MLSTELMVYPFSQKRDYLLCLLFFSKALVALPGVFYHRKSPPFSVSPSPLSLLFRLKGFVQHVLYSTSTGFQYLLPESIHLFCEGFHSFLPAPLTSEPFSYRLPIRFRSYPQALSNMNWWSLNQIQCLISQLHCFDNEVTCCVRNEVCLRVTQHFSEVSNPNHAPSSR